MKFQCFLIKTVSNPGSHSKQSRTNCTASKALKLIHHVFLVLNQVFATNNLESQLHKQTIGTSGEFDVKSQFSNHESRSTDLMVRKL